MRQRFPLLLALLILTIALTDARLTFAQQIELASQWNALLQRNHGWLAADGIYSLDLEFDSLNGNRRASKTPLRLFWFSDTFCGTTKNNGKEFNERTMVNHSFAILKGDLPDPNQITFFYNRNSNDKRVENIVDGRYWLQDGIRIGNKIWISAILVGEAWKPSRIDALTIELDSEGRPDFSTARVDTNAPLSIRTDSNLLDLGIAICDDAQDGFIYVYGYVDRLTQRSRKDLVVARVPCESFEDYSRWQYYDGKSWTDDPNALLDYEATLLYDVSTELSFSKISSGKNKGKYLIVYTPHTIGSQVAYRIADSPVGPFCKENLFYNSPIPQELPGVKCYNAKAHPVFATPNAILVSYNTNRLGELAHSPDEYRPRFLWLNWTTVDKSAQ